MPELPEVETVVRSLAPLLIGRRIVEANFSSRFVVRQDFDELAGRVRGQVVHSVRRHGKFILVELTEGTLAIHLGMTGKLLMDARPGDYTRALFELDRGLLVYDDVRHLGRIEWDIGLPKRVEKLGPDALAIQPDDFLALLRRRKAQIKPLLLNQRFLRGMGNIYTDEALFLARIHPKAESTRLRKDRALRLHQSMIDVLTLAIEHKGSSISDYVDAEGNRGDFQSRHQVYGRKGQPCPRCGNPIRRIVVAQRGTHYCARCQRM
ncbi:MAG: bifunctional DNA-formamidopyrimidine glycosylase/DNA-(apurinic or apyrimidinic site) lyase [Bryobacteraceae bacterium]